MQVDRRSNEAGEFDAADVAFVASIFAASVGMIWDLATGHVMALENRLCSEPNDGDDDFV